MKWYSKKSETFLQLEVKVKQYILLFIVIFSSITKEMHLFLFYNYHNRVSKI